MYPDAIRGGELVGSDGCIRWGGDSRRGRRGSFRGEFGRPIVTKWDFVA